MNLRQVEIFRAVVTHRTTARAAETLRISQPAVSKMLQALEQSVGFPLFHRTKGRLDPTVEGQLFFQEVEHAFAGLAKLRGAAARIRDYGSGEIRVASLSAFSNNIMPQAIAGFLAKHPGIAITYHSRMSSVVRDLVASGQFDLGVVADEIDRTGVECRPFIELRAALAMPEGHPLTKLEMVRPADLEGHNFLALSPEDTARQRAEAVFEQAGIKVRTVLETPYTMNICAMVANGLGVGLVDPMAADLFLNRGLVLRPFEPALNFRTLLILPPHRPPSRQVEALIAELHEAAGI
ncbi:LysR substrate-binding domain-containing protein [Halodurantibacterium flavum]|uniref:LysR substrate-binding domain-containing protein n=1 Tax=Halodurantibacterium flavum TaxID=1382802 RepID=A0ABW4RZP1_9RHOB